jgi:nicotinamidase-related amidase
MKNDSAILLIEFQKTWTEKGIFKSIIKNELKRQNTLENTKKLIDKARSNNIKIIQAPLILDKSDKKKYKKTPLPARLFNRFTKGTWKAEFTEGIYNKDSDILVIGRYGFDACKGSNLEELLKLYQVKKVYICGFTTDHCVKETMTSLINKGFDCVMVSNCTATRNIKLQRKIENNFTVITSQELIKTILPNE